MSEAAPKEAWLARSPASICPVRRRLGASQTSVFRRRTFGTRADEAMRVTTSTSGGMRKESSQIKLDQTVCWAQEEAEASLRDSMAAPGELAVLAARGTGLL